MSDQNNNNGANAQQLLIQLAEQGSLATWLNEPDIRRTCLRELKELGLRPPLNHVLFHALRHSLAAAQKGMGEALLARIAERIQQWPKVENFLEQLLLVKRGNSQLTQFKGALLARLRGEAASLPSPDEDTPLEMLVALHNGQAIAGLDEQLRTTFTQAIDALFGNLVAPSSHDPRQPDPQSAADYLRYDSGKYPFVGREDELQLLQRFLQQHQQQPRQAMQWMLITGAGGEGKSRLALQLWETLQDDASPWQALWLSKDAADTFNQQAAKWRPRRPTLMIIDYPARCPKAVGQMLANMAGNCGDYDFPVRVLLLERDAQGEWFTQAFPAGGETARLRQHRFAESDAQGVWPLPPLPKNGIVQLMRQRFHDANIHPPADEALWQKACAVDPNTDTNAAATQPSPRALFAAMIAEAAARRCQQEATDPAQALDDIRQSEVLDSLINRDRAQYWQPAAGGAGDDARDKLQAHEHLLVLATMTQGLDSTALTALDAELQAQLPKPGMGQRPRLDPDLLRRMSGHDNGRTRPLEPDILGEHYVLRWFESPDTDPALARHLRNSAFSLGDDAARFILRSLRDFPTRLHHLHWLAPDATANRQAARLWSTLAVDLTKFRSGMQAWSVLDSIMEHLDKTRLQFPDDREIAQRDAQTTVNVTNHAVVQQDWTRVDAMLARLDALRADFDDDREIVLAVALSAKNVTGFDSAQQDAPRVDAMLNRLDDLRSDFPDAPEIALEEAGAAFNILDQASKQQDSPRLDAMLARLDALRQAFSDDREIALTEAKAACNVINHAVSQQDWARISTMLDRIRAVRQAFAYDLEIAQVESNAVSSLISHASAQQDWALVDAMLGVLDPLRAAFADDHEIALSEAIAIFNLMKHAGAQQDWPRVDTMLARLDKLGAAFADDREIALAEAQAAVNVTGHAGAQQDWSRVDAMLDRLDALRATFADDREIALAEAQAAFNVTNAAGAHQDWPRVVEMEKRCAKLEQNFADDAATLGMTSAQRVLAYYARRAHGQYPAEDVTIAAVQSAM
ncbi:MAG: hypothetical protein Tsb0027_02100 [Wenzhouxiangellaceae bacterium]